jgi:hypothetical protein
MNKIYLLTLILCQMSLAQISTINNPEVISSAGNAMQAEGYILCSTLGEVVIETTIGGNEYIFTQGFQQQNNILSSIIKYPDLNNTYVFPNPTTNNIEIVFSEQYNHAVIQIKNIQGVIIQTKELLSFKQKESIKLNNLPQGIYFIELRLDLKKPIIHQIHKLN